MRKILIAGEGGQGIQAIAEILARAAFLESKQALYIPNFGVEQRGGVSLAFVTIDSQPIVYPKFEKADILAILSERSWERIKNYVGLQTKIIKGPAVEGGKSSNLPPKVWNVVVLGKINKLGKVISQENLIKALEKRFAKQFEKNPDLRKLDIRALTEV